MIQFRQLCRGRPQDDIVRFIIEAQSSKRIWYEITATAPCRDGHGLARRCRTHSLARFARLLVVVAAASAAGALPPRKNGPPREEGGPFASLRCRRPSFPRRFRLLLLRHPRRLRRLRRLHRLRHRRAGWGAAGRAACWVAPAAAAGGRGAAGRAAAPSASRIPT